MTAARRTPPSARRNAAVLAATTVTLGLLFLYPTSTGHGGSPRRPGQALAPAGVVVPTAAPEPTVRPTRRSAPTTLTVNGVSVDTQYGPVQVQVQVRAGRILSATAIDYPRGGGQSEQINRYAVPRLERETLVAQSAHVDTVSGATFTSEGYRRSLQAALDAAHRG